jgi:hypothetical protein
MNSDAARSLAELTVKLSRTDKGSEMNPLRLANLAHELVTLAARYSRVCEYECNYGQTDKTQSQKLKLANRIGAISRENFDVPSEYSGDPRGYCVYLKFPDGSYNTWGGSETGWGI